MDSIFSQQLAKNTVPINTLAVWEIKFPNKIGRLPFVTSGRAPFPERSFGLAPKESRSRLTP